MACSEDSSTNSKENDLPPEVADLEELETYTCSESIIGEKVYVQQKDLYYECDGEVWFKSYDQTPPSSSSENGSKNSSASKKCNDLFESCESSSSAKSSSSSKKVFACLNDSVYTETYDWIDGKTVFPEGTFTCSAEKCMSSKPLNSNKKYGEIVDERDGQVYKVIRIGQHVWFAQNLNFKTESSNYYSETLGRYYNWCDLMDLPAEECGMTIFSNISDINHQGRCPNGWHVPNYDETLDFFCALGSSSLNYIMSSAVSTGFTSDSTNLSGFSVVYYSRWADFALSTEYNEKASWSWTWCMGWDDYADVFPQPTSRISSGYWKTESYAVRCVKDEKTSGNSEEGRALPICDESSDSLVAAKDTMYFICKNGLWNRATDLERDTYGHTCTASEIGSVIQGNVNDSNKYACTALGWENMAQWSWNVPLYSRLNPEMEYGSFVDDRDGRTYKTTTINDKVWMAENLNYADSGKTPSLKDNSWCYENNEAYCDVVGRLYSWSAAVNGLSLDSDEKAVQACEGDTLCLQSVRVQGICPKGFHLPSYEEWNSISRKSPSWKTTNGWDDFYVSGYNNGYRSGNG